MFIRGAIYHHNKLRFHDGATGVKYLVLLNTPSNNDPFVFVKTTSKKKDKPSMPGCIDSKAVFHISSGTTYFPKDTWVQLSDLYPLPKKDLKLPGIKFINYLNEALIDKIVDCLFQSQEDDLPPVVKKLLLPPINESILKLQEKFNKKF